MSPSTAGMTGAISPPHQLGSGNALNECEGAGGGLNGLAARAWAMWRCFIIAGVWHNSLPPDPESSSALILRANLSLYSELHQEDIELPSPVRIVPDSLAIRLDHLSAELRVALNPGFQALPGKTHHHCLSIHATCTRMDPTN